jgi:AcrR family transcriptional regulator
MQPVASKNAVFETGPFAPDGKLDQILSISAKHFASSGFEAASLDQIAREVGIHKATLYHYIDSKNDILNRCLARSVAEYEDILEAIHAGSKPPTDLLRDFFSTHTRAQANEFGACLSAVGSEALVHEPGQAIRAFQGKLRDAVQLLITRGIETGAYRDIPVDVATQLAMGSFNWIWRWRRPGTGKSLDEIVEIYLDLILHGFAAKDIPIAPHDITAQNAEPGRQLKEKHRSLLTTAARMFSEQGYEATSLNDIADEVGLHKATLYHYVRNKASILAQCLEVSFDGIEQLEARLSAPGREPTEAFCEFLEHLVEAQNNEFGRCLNLIGPAPLKGTAEDRIRKFQRRLQILLEHILTEGRNTGLFRTDVPIMLTAAYVFGATNWVPHWLLPTTEHTTVGILPSFEDIFLNGISAT